MPVNRRLKPLFLLAGLAVAGLGLLCWTMPWFVVTLAGADAGHEAISVTGETAAPALSALSIAGLALVAALAIAGPFFRIVLAVLEALIGFSVMLSGIAALADPVAASAPLVTEATGIDGADSISRAIDTITTTAWPAAAIAVGSLMIVLGIAILVTARRWPGPSVRYRTVRLESADEPRSSVADWDSLSDGADPTGVDPAGDRPTGSAGPR